MKCAYILAVFSAFILFNAVKSDDLIVGNVTVGSQLVYSEKVDLGAIWLYSRNKNVFYSSESNKIIRAVQAIELVKTKATAKITAGGPGFTYINIKMDSETGKALKYQVHIYS